MPREGRTLISLDVSFDEKDKVNDLAKKRGYRMTADYLRALIERDAEQVGEQVEFVVNRGGDRRQAKN